MERQDLTRRQEKEMEELLGRFRPRQPEAGHAKRVLGPALAILPEKGSIESETGLRRRSRAHVWSALAAAVLVVIVLGSYLVDFHYRKVVVRLTSDRDAHVAELRMARQEEAVSESLPPAWREEHARLATIWQHMASRNSWRSGGYAARRELLEKLLKNGNGHDNGYPI